MTLRAIENHLYLRGHTYYFRISILKNLVPVLGITEYKKSLRTKDFKKARQISRLLSVFTERLFLEIANMTSETDDRINELVCNHFEKRLLDYAESLMCSRVVGERQGHWDAEEMGMSEIAYMKKQSQDNLQELLALKQEHDFGIKQQNVAKEYIEHNLIDIKEGDLAFDDFCYGLVRAQHEAERINYAYLNGNEHEGVIRDPLFKNCRNYFEQPDEGILGIETLGLNHIPEEGTDFHLRNQDLSNAYNSFYADKEQQGASEDELRKIKTIMNKLIWYYGGDFKVSKFQTLPHAKDIKNIIFNVPKGFSQKDIDNGIDFKRIINDGNNQEKLKGPTQQQYWQFYNQFFNYLKGWKQINQNPLEGIPVKFEESKKDARNAYKKEQLEAIFCKSPIYSGRQNKVRSLHKSGPHIYKDGNFWPPLLGIYTGARLGEIIALRHCDIKQDDEGTWYIDFNEEFHQKKNTQSCRKHPIHPELIKIGFLKYWEKRRNRCEKQNELLFADNNTIYLANIDSNYSEKWTKYLENLGIKTKKGDGSFHSFRHNYESQLRRLGIYKGDLFDALDGRKTDGSPRTRYSEDSIHVDRHGFTPTNLFPYVEKIDYGLDLSHLYEE